MERLLLKRFKKGDKAAFKRIYEAHADSALCLAKLIMKQDKLAEDAVQEAFIRAYIYRKNYDEYKPFLHWFNRILINECRRSIKVNQRKWSHLEPDAALKIGREDDYDFEKYQALYRALGALPEAYRTPLTLKYLNGYSEAAIADTLGLKKTTVKSRLYEGRQKMRQMLVRFGYGEDEDE